MSAEINGLCREHSFEPAEDLCRNCGGEFCVSCLVHPFGKPLCKSCAIAAAGVRTSGTHKPLNKRDLKRRLKAFETTRALKREPEEPAPVISDPVVGYDPIGAPSGEGMDRLGDPDPTVTIDPDLVAEAAARLAGTTPVSTPPEAEARLAGTTPVSTPPEAEARLAGTTPVSTPPEADDAPAGDVAPPIDWSKPFG